MADRYLTLTVPGLLHGFGADASEPERRVARYLAAAGTVGFDLEDLAGHAAVPREGLARLLMRWVVEGRLQVDVAAPVREAPPVAGSVAASLAGLAGTGGRAWVATADPLCISAVGVDAGAAEAQALEWLVSGDVARVMPGGVVLPISVGLPGQRLLLALGQLPPESRRAPLAALLTALSDLAGAALYSPVPS